jgi:hypothetical protein
LNQDLYLNNFFIINNNSNNISTQLQTPQISIPTATIYSTPATTTMKHYYISFRFVLFHSIIFH